MDERKRAMTDDNIEREINKRRMMILMIIQREREREMTHNRPPVHTITNRTDKLISRTKPSSLASRKIKLPL